jgi:hypothetical protein
MTALRIFAALTALAGLVILGWLVNDQFSGRVLLLIVAIALLMGGFAGVVAIRKSSDTGQAVAYVGCALLGFAVVAAPVGAAALADGSLDDWIPIYLAGAFGGLLLELLNRKGQIEVPGPGVPLSGDAAKDEAGSSGVQIDLGVCARLILGGLAAVVAIMLIAAAGSKDDTANALRDAAGANLSIGWAVAIGIASTAVWAALRKAAEQRVNAINVSADAENAGEAVDEAAEAVERARNRPASETQSAVTDLEELTSFLLDEGADEEVTRRAMDRVLTVTPQVRRFAAGTVPRGEANPSAADLGEVAGALRVAQRQLGRVAGRRPRQ